MFLFVPVIISVCWFAGASVGFLPLFGWHKAVDPHPDCYFVEVMDYNFLLFLYFATIITPSVLLAAFYAHIYRVVLKQVRIRPQLFISYIISSMGFIVINPLYVLIEGHESLVNGNV